MILLNIYRLKTRENITETYASGLVVFMMCYCSKVELTGDACLRSHSATAEVSGPRLCLAGTPVSTPLEWHGDVMKTE